MARSKMDPSQIVQTTYDEALEATRVSVLPMEMSIELDANDGDSVLALKQMQIIQAEANELVDSSKASRMSVSSDCSLIMVVDEIEISLGSLLAGQVKEICSPKIKVSVSCKIVLQS